MLAVGGAEEADEEEEGGSEGRRVVMPYHRSIRSRAVSASAEAKRVDR
jgi:hypothetical protein